MSEHRDPPARGLPEVIASRYHTVSVIGAGGMGTVYKAIDTRLNRAVAIKALHQTRLRELGGARLRAEALAAAALDHPFICKVYELIEEPEGTLIVMEFVEGETLAAILKRGLPAVGEVLQIGREIAEGLAAAHARGFVHRDVKPSNVMVTSHGHVKLLDFGLAQPDVAATPGAETRTSSARVSSHSGTPHYMSPEAAAGDPVTARADLFSLGAILFESLSGKLPFAGATPYDYVRHLLTSEPRPLYRLAPHAPADLVTLVERCLEKVPAKRPESAADVVSALARLSESLTGTGVKLPTASELHAQQRRRRWAAGAISAALATIAAVAIWWLIRPGPVELVRQNRPFVDWASDEVDSRVSPDGQWVSFISNRGGTPQLYLQPVDGAEAKPVALAAGRPVSHLWSADGREIACVVADGGRMRLEIVPAFFGGRARETVPIEPAPARVRLSRWIGDGVFLQTDAPPNVALHRADLGTRTLTNVSAAWKIDGRLAFVDVAPDGLQAAFVVQHPGQEDLWIAALDGTAARKLTNDAFFERYPLWTGDGSQIIVQSNRGGQIDLWAIDPHSGRSAALTSSLTVEIPEGTSANGRIVTFQQEFEDARLWAWDAEGGAGRQLSAAGLNEATPDASRDGRTVVVQRRKPTDLRAALTDATLLAGPFDPAATFEPRSIGDGFAATLSPDGRRVAFLHQGSAAAPILIVQQLDTNQRDVVSRHMRAPVNSTFPAGWAEHNADFTPDGRALYFLDQDGGYAVRRVDLDAPPGTAPVKIADVPAAGLARDVYVAPDGRSLSYLAWADKAMHVRVVDLASGRTRELATIPGRLTGVFGRGWLANGGDAVVVRALEINDDLTSTVEVLVVSASGSVRTAATVDRAYVSTARLDPAGTLTMTRSESGVHNVYRCTLSTGAISRVTDNRFQGLTFSALVPVANRVLIGVRHEVKLDIWLMTSKPALSER